ncbi:contactin-3 [Patella vulgata]|uniref:contactin-3 n=1 Tax=Patella vulgata TaxID=6465 RepID=UPI00217F6839|nr:contactin-3 [Patella vulgata]
MYLCIKLCILLYYVGTQAEVRLPPTITHVEQPQYFRDGKDVYMFCEAHGIPKPRFAWKHNGIVITKNDYMEFNPVLGNLTISNPTVREEGNYQCVAENKWGTSLSTVAPLVYARLDAFSEDTDLQTYNVKEGESVSVQCENMPKSRPDPIFSWYFKTIGTDKSETSQIKERDSLAIDVNGTLHLLNTKLADGHPGQVYLCGITNKELDKIVLGSETRITVEENTQASNTKPKLLMATHVVTEEIGKPVVLQCIFGGSPVPDIKWFSSSGEELTTDGVKYGVNKFGRQLTIKNVMEADEGSYSCVASNGEARANIKLNVTSPPIWTKTIISRHAVEGDDVTFNCKARSAVGERPVSMTEWYINGESLSLQKEAENGRQIELNPDQTTLTIKGVSRDRDIMCIQCRLSNSVGSVFKDGFLNVLKPIKIWSRPPSTIIYNQEEVVDFSINATTDPSRTIDRKWFLNNKVLVPYQTYFEYDSVTGTFLFNSTLVKPENLTAMMGLYTCQLSHQDQTVNVTFTFKINDTLIPPVVTPDSTSDPAKASSGIYIIAVMCGVLILVLAVVVILVLWKQRNPKAVYYLGAQEKKNFNLTPIDELETEELRMDTLNTLNESKLSVYSASHDAYASNTLNRSYDAYASNTLNRSYDAYASNTLNRSQDLYASNTLTQPQDPYASNILTRPQDPYASNTLTRPQHPCVSNTLPRPVM